MRTLWTAAAKPPLFSRHTKAAALPPQSKYIWFTLLVLSISQSAFACATCFGDPNSPMTKGTSNGIAFLLGTVFFVQLGFVAMFWSFWRRAKALRRRRESMRVIQGGAH
jgi:hypothetical protein